MTWAQMAVRTVREWLDDNAAQHAAALAFYTMFSLAPLVVIMVAIAGLVFGDTAARGELHGQVQQYLGTAGAQTLEDVLSHADREGSGTAAGLVGLGALLLGASGVFTQLRASMDVMFDVPPAPDAPWYAFAFNRLLAFTMVLGTGFLLLVSLVVSAVVSALVTWTGNFTGLTAWLIMAANLLVGAAVTAVLFAAIFRYVPSRRYPWAAVWWGALLTTVLFTLGRMLLGWYLGSGSVGSAYGAAGSLVIVLAWVYYSAQILFLGAEFTQVYATARPGRGGEPAD